jgi:molybdopterin molybdotransferase
VESLENVSLQDALAILLSDAIPVHETECVELWDARGRVLAEDAVASHAQPPFDRSPLDGYAVRSVDVAEASPEHPVRLLVVDEVCAGHVAAGRVESGTAIRIMTGAPIPKGADCVIRQEDSDYGEEEVQIYQGVGHHSNYCFAGEDYEAGACLLKKGSVLGPAEIGILASLGMEKVFVCRRPKAAVISTGDEIVAPGADLAPGKIYDSNLYTLVSQLESYGAKVCHRQWASDQADVVAEEIRDIAENVDLIITTGGVSVGKKDIMHDVIRILGAEPLFWRVAIKPGMPTLTARYQGKLLICLSGNPYGAFANAELLVKPIVLKISGRSNFETVRTKAVILNSYPRKSPVTRYLRAYYRDHQVQLADGSHSSGVFSTLNGCNCMVEVPAGTPFVQKGDEVTIVLFVSFF